MPKLLPGTIKVSTGKHPCLGSTVKIIIGNTQFRNGSTVGHRGGKRHPPSRKENGRRKVFKQALVKAYDKNVAFSGPVYKGMEKKHNRIILAFYQNKGLHLINKVLGNFEIAGADKTFYPAKAIVKKGKIVVSSEEVHNPEAVRYAFKGWVRGDLFNKAGFPASSFRTDSWDIKP